jgi:hypothetical protein
MKTQVWIAVSVYVSVATVRKDLLFNLSLSQILQIPSANHFEQVPLPELIAKAQNQNDSPDKRNQWMLWN